MGQKEELMSSAFESENNELLVCRDYHINDIVGWIYEDADIPLGSKGTITNIKGEDAWVQFPSGLFTLSQHELFRTEIDRFGFSTGEWVAQRNAKLDDMYGRLGPGIVTGFEGENIKVRFRA